MPLPLAEIACNKNNNDDDDAYWLVPAGSALFHFLQSEATLLNG